MGHFVWRARGVACPSVYRIASTTGVSAIGCGAFCAKVSALALETAPPNDGHKTFVCAQLPNCEAFEHKLDACDALFLSHEYAMANGTALGTAGGEWFDRVDD